MSTGGSILEGLVMGQEAKERRADRQRRIALDAADQEMRKQEMSLRQAQEQRLAREHAATEGLNQWYKQQTIEGNKQKETDLQGDRESKRAEGRRAHMLAAATAAGKVGTTPKEFQDTYKYLMSEYDRSEKSAPIAAGQPGGPGGPGLQQPSAPQPTLSSSGNSAGLPMGGGMPQGGLPGMAPAGMNPMQGGPPMGGQPQQPSAINQVPPAIQALIASRNANAGRANAGVDNINSQIDSRQTRDQILKAKAARDEKMLPILKAEHEARIGKMGEETAKLKLMTEEMPEAFTAHKALWEAGLKLKQITTAYTSQKMALGLRADDRAQKHLDIAMRKEARAALDGTGPEYKNWQDRSDRAIKDVSVGQKTLLVTRKQLDALTSKLDAVSKLTDAPSKAAIPAMRDEVLQQAALVQQATDALKQSQEKQSRVQKVFESVKTGLAHARAQAKADGLLPEDAAGGPVAPARVDSKDMRPAGPPPGFEERDGPKGYGYYKKK